MKEKIISEIQRLAVELGDAPGNRTFMNETGIKDSEWKGIFWARWGDALLDAGLQPNDIQQRHENEFLLQKYCEATLHYNKPPTKPEMRMYSKQVDGYPSYTTMLERFGSMANIRQQARTWAGENEAFSGVLQLIEPAEATTRPDTASVADDGWVYLLQSGAHYKIGRGQELERRVKQISIALPEKVELGSKRSPTRRIKAEGRRLWGFAAQTLSALGVSSGPWCGDTSGAVGQFMFAKPGWFAGVHLCQQSRRAVGTARATSGGLWPWFRLRLLKGTKWSLFDADRRATALMIRMFLARQHFCCLGCNSPVYESGQQLRPS